MKANLTSLVLTMTLALCVTSCRNDTGSDSSLQSITHDYDAEFIIGNLISGVLYNNVVAKITQGNHSGTSVEGLSGNVRVTGKFNFSSGINCGTDCVKSESDIDLTMVFTKYRVMSNDNTESTISGTVHYTDNTWSRQSGLGHSSGGTIEADGSGVDYKAVFDNSGYQDKFSFSASGATLYSFSGWCIPKNGIRYEF
jgi:hypothetical protein